VPDETTYADALAILEKYAVSPPPEVRHHLAAGAAGRVDDTVKPGDRRIRSSSYTVIGNRTTAIDAARRAAEAQGYNVVIVPEVIAGEARQAGAAFLAAAVRTAAASSRPLCVIGAGETTVTVVGDGIGGRNQEFVLGALSRIDAGETIVFGSAGTDGIDGPTDAAGALADSTTATRAMAAGLSSGESLRRNDAYRFFDALDDLIRWGATGTNVGDLHIALIA
jgi:glycerate 2-kinase